MKIKIESNKYFKRRIDKQLIEWAKNNQEKTIALINGARRTGKTHSLAYLGQNSFLDYQIIEVQKLNIKTIKRFLEKEKNVQNFIEYLLVNFNIRIDQITNDLLIVFDEIQEHNELKEAISLFNTNLKCRFACTGSALWINDTNGTRPTSDYELFNVFPFSFKEFLTITGGNVDVFNKEKELFKLQKNKNSDKNLLKALRLYIAVGGMPQSINYYLEHIEDPNLFYKLNRNKRTTIVNTYENDLQRYSKQFSLPLFNEYKLITREYGRIKNVGELDSTYEKLKAMNIVIAAKNVLNINSKLLSSTDSSHIKPFLLDVGILFYYLCDSDNEKAVNSFYDNFINGKDGDDNGFLYENYVASTIAQYDLTPFFKTFTSESENGHEKTYEIDFIVSGERGDVVLEAKSGQDKEHKSLKQALIKYKKIKSSYILCNGYKFNKENIQRGPHLIPFYAIDFILE